MALHSPHWHRVAALAPRLAPQVRVTRQRHRGQTWWLLHDELTGRSARLNRSAYELAARLDGATTVQALWDQAQSRPQEPPTQDEVVELLARLREQGLVDGQANTDFHTLLPHLRQGAQARSRGNLLAWRFPMGNPTAWLRLFQRVQPLLFSRPAAWLWALATLWLAATAALHASELWAYGGRWAATPRFALLALLAWLPIKLVHETAHGLALRQFGATVREAGVTLMLFMPMPYVDASAAAALPSTRQRMVVSAAGIAAELLLAALALAAWLALPDGLAREMAFVVFSVAGLSTLLFNANPLQRLDGYHLATDALQLPNLAPRSREYWLDLLRQRVLRLPEHDPFPVAPGEAPWLLAYAPLSWAWGLGLAALGVAWLAAISAPLGAAAGLVLFVQLALLPAVRLLRQLGQQAAGQRQPRQRLQRAVALTGGVLAASLLLPLPQHRSAQGLVWPPEQAQLRADTEGFVHELHIADGQPVAAGDLVLELANPRLQAQRAQQAARVAAIESDLIQASGSAAPAGERRGNAQADLAAAQAELARTDERLAGLLLRAQAAGTLALPGADDLGAQWVPQGRLLGQVLTGAAPVVKLAVPEDEAPSAQAQTRPVSVRLRDADATRRSGRLQRDSLAAVTRLPSAALSQASGGELLTDPQDKDHLRTLRPVVLMDVVLDAPLPGAGLGQRAWVRFDEGWSPLAWQAFKALQRQWLRRMNPQH
ncbi:membrane-fusion protein [Burkholderiales bacterium JOSHI_001]|nr:membrane-fusion protein [Burkholderiales bacterium JOSHI_001]